MKNWLLRKAKRAAVAIAVAVVLSIGVRATVAEVFYTPTNAVAPEVPRNARVLVYKLGRTFKAADIVVYRQPDGVAMLGRVVAVDVDRVTIARGDKPVQSVPLAQVVGRVVLNTR
jgi:signal peptidase I